MTADTYQCHRCGQTLTSENLNILALLGVQLKLMCDACYVSQEKRFIRNLLYVPNVPINSQTFHISILVWTFLAYPFLMSVLYGDALGKATAEGKGGALVIFFMAFITLHLAWTWFLYLRARKIEKSI